MTTKMTGAELIAAERRAQTTREDYYDEHTDESLALAAACYAMPARVRDWSTHDDRPRLWPWARRW